MLTFLIFCLSAGGGATVDEDILKSKFPQERSFEDQVLLDWIPNYVKSKPSQYNWTGNDTLFAIFFGLNDCRDAYFKGWTSISNVTVSRQMGSRAASSLKFHVALSETYVDTLPVAFRQGTPLLWTICIRMGPGISSS